MSQCPVCDDALVVIGSRRRTRRLATAERQVLVIRRLRCTGCRWIHHELPACLVPYQRYDAETLEAMAAPAAAPCAAHPARLPKAIAAVFRAGAGTCGH
ncbi:MAG: DUF6431 domain-containing protein [Thermaerobacter sp.]|nr:DUF6431 domain-containing protein [Thermaerobacter sp.]